MSLLICRLGDTSTHGGSIVTAAKQSICEGQKIARIGDILACPRHGPRKIIEGSPKFLTEGRKTARHTSLVECGARLISKAKKSYCE